MLPLLYQDTFLLIVSKNQITIFTSNLNFVSRIKNKITIVQLGCTQNNASILLYLCRKSITGIPINTTNINTTNGKIAQTHFENILRTNPKVLHDIGSMPSFLDHGNKIYFFSSKRIKIECFFLLLLILFGFRYNNGFNNLFVMLVVNSFQYLFCCG